MARRRGSNQANNQRSNSKNPNNPAYHTSRNNRSNQYNPTSKAYQARVDNRANQHNPQHRAYHSSRGTGQESAWDDYDESAALAEDKSILSIPKPIVKKVESAFRTILERETDLAGLKYFGQSLESGAKSMREIVRELGKSEEYQTRFIQSVTPQEAIRLMYRHFLVREPESEEAIKSHLNYVGEQGWKSLIDVFVDSEEYQSRFGEHKPPVS